MTSNRPSLHPNPKGPSVASTPAFRRDGVGSTSNIYTRRREQVRKAQRSHRHRQKAYVKEMEDEVSRLQEEWAAVMQEIQQASNENLVLKEILMLSLSHPYAQDGSGATTCPRPVEQMQHMQAGSIDPKSHFRLMVDHVELSTSTCTDMTSPSSYFEELAPLDCSHAKALETFDFWPPVSTSHEENQHHSGLQHRTAEEMDGKTFASFPSLSHGPTDKLDTSHYMHLEPARSATGFMFSADEHYLGTGHDQFDRLEAPDYYDMAGFTSL